MPAGSDTALVTIGAMSGAAPLTSGARVSVFGITNTGAMTVVGTSHAMLSITGQPEVSIAVLIPTSGPDLTIAFSGPATSVRFLCRRSDNALTSQGRPYFFDSGWVPMAVADRATATYTLNAVESGIPTDTGTGSADTTLHLVIEVLTTTEVGTPTNPALWVTTSSPLFDLHWGVPTVGWSIPPAHLISTTQVTLQWNYSDSRSFAQETYAVILSSVDGAITYYDSGPVVSTASSVTPPYPLVSGTSYQVNLLIYNTNGVPAPLVSAMFVAGQQPPSYVPSGGLLERFLDMLAFNLNTSRSLIEQLRYVNDPIRCPGNLLPLLAQELGVSYEAEMGMAQTRKLLKTVVHQYKMKGTSEGVEGITTAVTGWPATVGIGPNLMLGPGHLPMPPADPPFNDVGTAFNSPTAFFGGLDLGQSYITGTTTTPTVPSSYLGTYWPSSWPTALPYACPGYALWSTGDLQPIPTMTWDSLQGGTVQEWGVPLPSRLYSVVSVGLEVWMGGLRPQPSLGMTVNFWGQEGNLISSSSSPTAVEPSNGEWTLVKLENLAVPSGTQWLSFTVTSQVPFSFAAGQGVFILSSPQVEPAAHLAPYSPPREVLITLTADRANLIENPSFENGSAMGWTALTNCSVTPVSGVAYESVSVPNPGSWSLQVTSTASGPMTVQSSPMPVISALLYTASAYVQARATAQHVSISIIGSSSEGSTVTETYSSLSSVLEVVGQWVRPYAQVDPASPWVGVDRAVVQVNWLNTSAAGEVHYLDAILFEEGWNTPPQPYFDADTWVGSPHASDYYWANPSLKQGPSFYYKNMNAKIERLTSVLNGMNNTSSLAQRAPLTITGFLPLGVSFLLLTGSAAQQEALAGVPFNDANTSFNSTLVTMNE